MAEAFEVQTTDSWGLDFVAFPLDDTYSWSWDGEGVDAYVLDTGIFVGHSDFGGRATCAFDAINETNGCRDGTGHGSSVAGIIGGKQSGVAKKVALKAVRVLDDRGKGTLSTVAAGIDWILKDREAIEKEERAPAVINLRYAT